MKKYNVEIVENLSRVVMQEADSYEEAQDIVEEKYRNSEYVLDYEDYNDTKFKPYPSQEIRKDFNVSFNYDAKDRILYVDDCKGTMNYGCKTYEDLEYLFKYYFENNVELNEVKPEKELKIDKGREER